MAASSVSGAQFQFVPRIAMGPAIETPAAAGEDDGGPGEAGREWKGPRSVAPIARGAFSSQDQALSFRHMGENTLSHGAKNLGSWLFKMDT